jgi:4-diphosphocytidyl-2-C-methyl-D-erythritol kinase
MHVRSAAAGLEVLTPAKLNLFLEVLGKRDDGFHEIETLMAPIGLYDTLYFQRDPSGRIQLACEHVDSQPSAPAGEQLPEGSQNIVFRAIDLIRRRYQVAAGARVRLVKRIPLAAGLAGGSSDAAAALVAANRVWGLNLPAAELAPLAAELGSDVPFFLEPGPAICRGRGERIERVAGLGALSFIMVRPPGGLSTADVYRACRPAAAPKSAVPLVESLRAGRLSEAGGWFHNALQAAAEQLSPWIVRLKQEFSRLDCLGHRMSGSGTSYFGLARHFRHAQRLAAHLQTRGLGRVYVVRGTC